MRKYGSSKFQALSTCRRERLMASDLEFSSFLLSTHHLFVGYLPRFPRFNLLYSQGPTVSFVVNNKNKKTLSPSPRGFGSGGFHCVNF